MNKKAYDILLFSYYRDAELRGADLILRLINHTESAQLQENLARHLADETEHSWKWTERIRALGGQPVRIVDGYHRHLRRKAGLPSHLSTCSPSRMSSKSVPINVTKNTPLVRMLILRPSKCCRKCVKMRTGI